MTGKIMTDTDYVKSPVGGTAFYAASGVSPGSGVISSIGFDGPWYIETQSLNIEYLRVPAGGLDASATTLSLVGATTSHGPISKTQVVSKVTATYSTRLDHATYTTPGYQQAQLFQVNSASADPNGVSYGAVNASSMGPMGSITTTQPYYRRAAYTGTSQPLINKVTDGATFPMQTWVDGYAGSAGVIVDNYWTEYRYWKDEGARPGTHRFGVIPVIMFWPNDYTIWGEFNTSKETANGITSYIDMVGHKIASLNLFNNPTNTTSLPGMGAMHTPLRDTGIAEYDINKHQY